MRPLRFTVAWAASLCFAAASLQATIIVNGNFETGDFTGWTTNAGTGGGSIVNVAAESAFTSGSRSALLTDGAVADSEPTLTQTFTDLTTGVYGYSFDFRINSAGSGRIWNAGYNDGGALGARFTIDRSNTGPTFSFRVDGFGGSDLDLTLSVGTWYRVAGTFNMDTKTYSGSVSNTSGTVAGSVFNNFSFNNASAVAIDRFELDDSDSGNQNATINLDNVFLQQLVPEPSVVSLLLGGLGLLAVRRRVR